VQYKVPVVGVRVLVDVVDALIVERGASALDTMQFVTLLK
jgi:hypothetical protein